MDPRAIEAHIRSLREARVRKPPELSLEGVFGGVARDLERRRDRAAGAGDAWISCCPPELLERTALASLTHGVLTVRVRDSATRFLLDRALRSGVEQRVITMSVAPVRKIRVVLSQDDPG